MRYAMIENGFVINTIMWDGISNWPLPDGVTVIQSDTLNIGDMV